jgi:hypothetical protein
MNRTVDQIRREIDSEHERTNRLRADLAEAMRSQVCVVYAIYEIAMYSDRLIGLYVNRPNIDRYETPNQYVKEIPVQEWKEKA